MTGPFLQLLLSTLFYFAAAGLHLAAFLKSDERSEKSAALFIRLGFICATIFLGLEASQHGFAFPILNFGHVLAFFAWALAFFYVLPLASDEVRSFGIVFAPLLCALQVAALAHVSDAPYALEVGLYFGLHICFAFFAYAALTLSFTAALMYLIQHRELKARRSGTFYHKLPNLEALDRLTYRPMFFGVVLLVCAIVIGILWAREMYGSVWIKDPKTFLTVIVVAMYSFLMILRLKASMRLSRIALLSIFVFIVMILSFIGGRFLSGAHEEAVDQKSPVAVARV